MFNLDDKNKVISQLQEGAKANGEKNLKDLALVKYMQDGVTDAVKAMLEEQAHLINNARDVMLKYLT